MKCFCHPAVDAVAICKSCGRALCRECVVEVGLGCSCRNRCEDDVATLNDLAERGRTTYQKTSASYFRAGWFMVLLGGAFLFLGAIGIVDRAAGPMEYFLSVAGLLFAGWGISHFVSAKRMREK